jgi:ribbon-helix-helix CopG family protein
MVGSRRRVVHVAAEFPVELREELEEHARRNGRSLSAELRRAAAVYLEVNPISAAQLLEEREGR